MTFRQAPVTFCVYHLNMAFMSWRKVISAGRGAATVALAVLGVHTQQAHTQEKEAAEPTTPAHATGTRTMTRRRVVSPA